MNRLLSVLFPLLTVGLYAVAQTPPHNEPARTLVHMLDYIAQDYPGAVAEGKIISAEEYKEMQEFSGSASSIATTVSELTADREIQEQLRTLGTLVNSKADAAAVAATARAAKQRALQLTKLAVAPTSWPSLANGATLFQQDCAACHGKAGHGDGPASATLEPKPTNFHDAARMSQLAPFGVFNTVRLGVQGTAMAPFPTLSDKDVWDLAFYVLSLRHEGSVAHAGANVHAALPLEVVATKSDAELAEILSGTDRNKPRAVATIRLRPVSTEEPSAVALARLAQALRDYGTGDFTSARSNALLAYLEGVEPIEPRLRALDAAATAELERKMMAVRSAIEGRVSAERLATLIGDASDAIKQADLALAAQTSSPWFTFSVSAAVILREGFEAILVIIAILGVVRAVGSHKAARWVHGGWLSALLLGIATWFFSEQLMTLSGLKRELMEGITSLVAVTILLYLGFWLHSKTEIGRWKHFIEGRVRTALEGGNLFSLATISFLAVFREAFETVIFLSALGLEGGANAKQFMAFGVFSSLALVIGGAAVLVRFSARIPIRTLFGLSSAVMAGLAIVLTGKGLHALQESGVLPATASPLRLHWDLMGLYPSVETLVLQTAVLFVALVLWALARRPSRPLAQEKGS